MRQPCATALESKLAEHLSSARRVDESRVRGTVIHELMLTCLEFEGLTRLADAADCSLDDFVRDAVTNEVGRVTVEIV